MKLYLVLAYSADVIQPAVMAYSVNREAMETIAEQEASTWPDGTYRIRCQAVDIPDVREVFP